MCKWKISELSRLTGISVRTLHHYDHIGLLKASERQANGFRVYGRKELQVLIKIFSLKFLGFELSAIKSLLDETISVKEKFLFQKKIIDEKIKILSRASRILDKLAKVDDFIDLDLVLKLIEIHRVSQQLEKIKAKPLFDRSMTDQVNEFTLKLAGALENLETLPNKDLIDLYDGILEEVYAIFPDTLNHKKDSELLKNKFDLEI